MMALQKKRGAAVFVNSFKQDKVIPQEKIIFEQLPKDEHCLGLFFVNVYEKFHADINEAIAEYNSVVDPAAKKTALLKMQAAIQYVDLYDSVYPCNFHKVRKNIFNKIKAVYAELGIYTMLQDGAKHSPITHIIANMSPNKADNLMEILHQGKNEMSIKVQAAIQDNLANLYSANDDSLEANQWRAFLKKHSLEFIGGIFCRNYKVTNIDCDDPDYGMIKVLRIDNRQSMPRHVEHYLRGKLSDVLISIDAYRQVEGISDSGYSEARTLHARTLLVTDFYDTVENHSKRAIQEGHEATLKACCDIISQIAQVYMRINEANCCFTDSKIINWMLDAKGKVRIADTKSFVFTQNGIYSRTVPGNEKAYILVSEGFAPTEIREVIFSAEAQNKISFHADALHSSLLGRNIYAFLTHLWPDPFRLNNMSEPIFNSAIGKELKQLIQQLIQDPADSRMSVSDAFKTLQGLKIRMDSPDYQKLRDSLVALKFGNNDKHMDNFLAECDKAIMRCENQEEGLTIMARQMKIMHQLITALDSNENKAIREIINKLTREKQVGFLSFLTRAMNVRKARKIESIMALAPIEERVQLLKSNHPAAIKALKIIECYKCGV